MHIHFDGAVKLRVDHRRAIGQEWLPSTSRLRLSVSVECLRHGNPMSAQIASLQTFFCTVSPSILESKDCTSIFVAMTDRSFRTTLRRVGSKTQKGLEKAARQACTCLLCICCAPCVCCVLIIMAYGQHSRNRRYRRRARPIQYPVMPYPRRRRLTISCEDAAPKEWQVDQRTLDQTPSPFFQKLPLEIRRMIYQKALGDEVVHLWHFKEGIHSHNAPKRGCNCCARLAQGEPNFKFGLGLLRACRKM